VFVDNGQGHYIMPHLLRELGYPRIAERVPDSWVTAYEAAIEGGVPEPSGKNCQHAYKYASQALDQLLNDSRVKAAIVEEREEEEKRRIRTILEEGVERGNEKMLRGIGGCHPIRIGIDSWRFRVISLWSSSVKQLV